MKIYTRTRQEKNIMKTETNTNRLPLPLQRCIVVRLSISRFPPLVTFTDNTSFLRRDAELMKRICMETFALLVRESSSFL